MHPSGNELVRHDRRGEEANNQSAAEGIDPPVEQEETVVNAAIHPAALHTPAANGMGNGHEAKPKSILGKVDEARRQAEIEAIISALNASLWNRKQAANLLSIEYKALLYKMKKLGIGEKPVGAATVA